MTTNGHPQESLPAIFDQIRLERESQDRRWGGQKHDDRHTSTEWAGFVFQYAASSISGEFTPAAFRHRMVQVAALAVAAIQWVDRWEARRVDAATKKDPKFTGE